MITISNYIIDNKELMKEWNYEKNIGINPKDYTYGSEKKVWWKCPKGHDYQAMIGNRVRLNTGCPYCANKKVLKGYNDLATTDKKMLELWNWSKNTLTPYEVTRVSGKKVWWKCPKGHEWQDTISHIAYGRNCPYCHNESSTSFPEQAIFFYLNKIDDTVYNRFKFQKKYEIDVFVEDKGIAIEYDGYKWHKTQEKLTHDLKKENIFIENGLKVIRIKDIDKKERVIENFEIQGNNYLFNYKIEILDEIIKDIIYRFFNKYIAINIKDDYEKILQSYKKNEEKGSIINNEYIMKMWNYDKNKDLEPSYFKPNSDYFVWWKCPKGHEFKARIHSMNEKKQCPECKKYCIKNNSLLKKEPNIAKEWNYKKNGLLTPEMIEPNSNKKVWWICSKGHEWQAVVSSRKNSNCPVCANRLIIVGVNDIKTLYPKLEKEWDYKKNSANNIYIDKISTGTSKKVWWKCSVCGNSWQSSVLLRTNMNCGCPKCSFKKAGENFSKSAAEKNNLKKKFPELCDEWNYEKNEKKPEEYSTGSGKKVWWKCLKCGYEWESYIYNRIKGFGKCPICKKQKK